jgi:hypothetical protein
MKSAWLVPMLRALLLTALAATPAFASAAVTVLIDSAAFPAELRENTDLLSRVRGATPSQARHYAANSRASSIRGCGSRTSAAIGRVWYRSADNASSSTPLRQPDGDGDIVLDALSPTELMPGASCATEAVTTSNVTLAKELSSGTANADFAAACQTKVDGVCLLAELDIAFDLLFQQTVPSTYRDRAAAIVNIIDGYYRNDFGIQFDVLSMTFLTTDLFSTTTDSSALLSDISNKKNAGQIPFVTNNRAVFHLVTGRNFAGTTIGIANVAQLCSTVDNTGTAQIVQNTLGQNDVPLTALVIAHEIGHNFGRATRRNRQLVRPWIHHGWDAGAKRHQFSPCSIDEITTKINSIPNLSACFEFPVDAVLTAHAANPKNAAANETFTLDYDISETHASVASAELRAAGSFAATGGTFVSATINGLACSVASDGQSYQCVTGSGGGLLEVTARVAGGAAMTIEANVTVGAGGGAKDVDTSNNSASQTVSTSPGPAAPSALVASPTAGSINLTWQDNSANEDGFRVERRTGTAAFAQIATTAANATAYSDATAASGVAYDYRVEAFGPGGTSSPSPTASALIAAGGGGGGGGGSFGAELAPLLVALFALRRRGSRAA